MLTVTVQVTSDEDDGSNDGGDVDGAGKANWHCYGGNGDNSDINAASNRGSLVKLDIAVPYSTHRRLEATRKNHIFFRKKQCFYSRSVVY